MRELPEGWAMAPLQDLAANELNALTDGPFGSNLKTSDYVSSGARVIRLGNIGIGEFLDEDRSFISPSKYEELRKHEALGGDLVIAALAEPVGRCAEVPAHVVPAVVKADCVRLKVHPEICTRYVMYCLNSPQGRQRAEAAAHGLGRLRINMGDMRTLDVPVAPLAEQRRIADKIDALTSRSRRAREALDAIPALLEDLRRSVLAAAFRGDLTADWRKEHPDVEPAEVLLAEIRQERRRRWEAAEMAKMVAKGKPPADDRWKERYEEPAGVDPEGLPELPEGWCWASLDELTFLAGGVTKGQRRRGDEVLRAVPYLRVANVQRGRLDLTEVKEIEATEEEIRELRLLPGDILLNEGGDRDKLGRGWIWSGELPECIHQNHVFRARPVSARVQSAYVSHYANTFGQHFFIDAGKQTTNLASVSMSSVRRLPVALAPAAEQAQVVRHLDRYLGVAHQQVVAQQHLEGDLRLLDRAILSQAFRGDLVPQDPADEPATALLERLRAERAQAPAPTRGRGGKGAGKRR